MDKALNQVVNDKSFDISNSERMFCATISIASEMGGNSARVFERIGDTFYQNYELKADTGAALAQVKISTVVIGLLPVGMLLFSLILGADATSFLFTNPIGLVCLILGGSLEIIGVCWMRLLVQRGVGIWTS